MWLKRTRPPTDHRADYTQALAAPPSPVHLAWLRAHGYTGPAPRTQAEASRLVNRLAAHLTPHEASDATN